MKSHKLFLLMISLVGSLFMLAPEGWAKVVAGGSPSCQVSKLPQGSVALNATMAAEALNIVFSGSSVADFPTDVDFAIRVEKNNNRHFFRLHLFKVIGFVSLGNAQIVCLALDPNAAIAVEGAADANQPAVSALVQDILTQFGLTSKTKLVITSGSVTRDEPSEANKIIQNTGTLTQQGFLSDAHAASLADVTIYAIP